MITEIHARPDERFIEIQSNYNQIFFARSVYEQCVLRSLVSFAEHKIKPGQLTAGRHNR